jgi:hypothetical protein
MCRTGETVIMILLLDLSIELNGLYFEYFFESYRLTTIAFQTAFEALFMTISNALLSLFR